MREFFARDGSPFDDEDAQECGPELVRLAEKGASSPAEIVKYAKQNETPLRKRLHLDRPLEEVANAWYRQRARMLAGSIMVNVQTRKGDYRSVRAFQSVRVAVSDPEEDRQRTERVYVTQDQLRESETMSKQVLDDALSRLRAWEKRYADQRDVLIRHHPSLERVFEAINCAVEAA